jgi:hypothetical protein
MLATGDTFAWMALAQGGHLYPRLRGRRQRMRPPQHADAVAAAAVLREADAGHGEAAERIAVDAGIDGLDRRELEALVTLFHVEVLEHPLADLTCPDKTLPVCLDDILPDW